MIDMMEKTKLRELKNVSGGLDPGDRAQIQDLIGLIGSEAPLRSGETRKVESLEVKLPVRPAQGQPEVHAHHAGEQFRPADPVRDLQHPRRCG